MTSIWQTIMIVVLYYNDPAWPPCKEQVTLPGTRNKDGDGDGGGGDDHDVVDYDDDDDNDNDNDDPHLSPRTEETFSEQRYTGSPCPALSCCCCSDSEESRGCRGPL